MPSACHCHLSFAGVVPGFLQVYFLSKWNVFHTLIECQRAPRTRVSGAQVGIAGRLCSILPNVTEASPLASSMPRFVSTGFH